MAPSQLFIILVRCFQKMSQITYHRLSNHREPFSLLSKSCRRRPWCRLPGDQFHILYFRRRRCQEGTRTVYCPSDLTSRRVLHLSLLCRSLSPPLLRHRSGSQKPLTFCSILHSHRRRVSAPEAHTVLYPVLVHHTSSFCCLAL